MEPGPGAEGPGAGGSGEREEAVKQPGSSSSKRSMFAIWRRPGELARDAVRVLSEVPEAVPILGHALGAGHCCLGRRERGALAARRASRNCAVAGAGAAVFCLAGPPAAAALPGSAAAGCALHVAGAAATAGAAGVLSGLAVDALWGRWAEVPRPLAAGDWSSAVALRLVDALKGVSGLVIATVLLPEHVTHVAVFTQPISAGEVGSLLGDALGSEYKGLLPHFLQQAPTPAAHAYAVLETSKARVFITERVHDGRVLLENLGDGSMAPFAHGRELGAQPMEAEFRAAGHSGAHPGPALGRLPAGAASAQPTPFAAARVEGGPPVAAVGALARAESLSDYDLLKANCQHYANDVFKVVSGHPLKKLPNQELMAAARMFGIGGPALSPAVAAPSALEQLRWAAGQAPVRLAAAAAVACAPAPGARCAEDGGSGGA